jgi:hypothetical protein
MTVMMLNGSANQIHFLTIMYSENMTVVILSHSMLIRYIFPKYCAVKI